MARNRSANFAALTLNLTADNCLISFVHASTCKLRRKREVSIVVLRDDEAAAGIFVETVNDAGARNAANTAQLSAAMMKQRIDQRMFLVPSCRMDDQSDRLVQDQQRLVFMKNIQGHVFRLRFSRASLRPMNFNLFACAGSMSRLDGFAIDPDVAFFDQPLDCTPGDGGKFGAKIRIQPFCGERSIQD